MVSARDFSLHTRSVVEAKTVWRLTQEATKAEERKSKNTFYSAHIILLLTIRCYDIWDIEADCAVLYLLIIISFLL